MLHKIWSKYNYLFGVASGIAGAWLTTQRSRVASGRRVNTKHAILSWRKRLLPLSSLLSLTSHTTPHHSLSLSSLHVFFLTSNVVFFFFFFFLIFTRVLLSQSGEKLICLYLLFIYFGFLLQFDEWLLRSCNWSFHLCNIFIVRSTLFRLLNWEKLLVNFLQ